MPNRKPYTNNPGKREALRYKMFEEQQGLCHLCGKMMTMNREHPTFPGKLNYEFATFDHIVPYSLGGRVTHRNLKLAHYRCNTIRGNKPVELFT